MRVRALLLLALSFGAGACSGPAAPPGEDDAALADAPSSDATSSDAPSTDAPSGDAAPADAPQADAASSEPPASDAASIDGPSTDATPDCGCVDQACVDGTCRGVCSPNQVECQGQQPVVCSPLGAWQSSGDACSGATPVCLNGACVTCAPGSVQCDGAQPQVCDAAETWQNTGDACSESTPVCVNGACAECNPDPTQDGGAACSASTPVCLSGVCVACSPGATECASATTWQVCGPDGQWMAEATCPSGACSGGRCETTTATSCETSAPGVSDCGAGGESCCTSIEVPGGTYNRTYDNAGSGPTGEAYPASVSGFRMDAYLVTVGRFRAFVAAWSGGAGYLPPAGSGKHAHLNAGQGLASSTAGSQASFEAGWDATDWNANIAPTDANLASCPPYSTWTPAPGSQESLPIDCVNWWEAYAFCIWDGGFLPSEAEWEYVAAGGAQEREYPWGTATPGTACPGTGCDYAIYDCDYPDGSGDCAGLDNLAPVGTAAMGAGLWGHLDLEGEVWQWTLDWFDDYASGPCTDCANVSGASTKVDRGSFFASVPSYLFPSLRYALAPDARGNNIGFRCARAP
ncbi:MAG: SUMF1/EgtB/PvdO family nonheme iron enzyme [Polyangiaceae bacterium]|nr:SUMF1/EgtB/PvdO family nonheme iron enzyme [Polyangiaceae bacterium]